MSESSRAEGPTSGDDTPSAPTEATAMVGVPLPADLLVSDPAILGESLRGSGTPEGAVFTADLAPETQHR
ncbi:hypothetical protein SAMN04515665_11440 [Blastococcus sp. DSM 46786]|nr:hypothetical protein SAMN04515665_11440 [Blastococcus sp. DSM 46786]